MIDERRGARFKPSGVCDARPPTTPPKSGGFNPRSIMDKELRRVRFGALADHFYNLADRIEQGTAAALAWDQSDWGSLYDTSAWPEVGELPVDQYGDLGVVPFGNVDVFSCGAHACIAGWAAMKFAPEQLLVQFHRKCNEEGSMIRTYGSLLTAPDSDSLSVEGVATDALQLDVDEADELFSGGWAPPGYVQYWGIADAEGRAANTRRLADELLRLGTQYLDGSPL